MQSVKGIAEVHINLTKNRVPVSLTWLSPTFRPLERVLYDTCFSLVTDVGENPVCRKVLSSSPEALAPAQRARVLDQRRIVSDSRVQSQKSDLWV